MSLDLQVTDKIGVFNWIITYGQDSTLQRREYQLQKIDSTERHYLIDEKNGILLDAFFIRDELMSIFAVMGNTLLTSYQFHKDEIIFSVKVYSSKEVRISGDTLIEGQEVPTVFSFKPTVNQITRLQIKG